jgi:hypothetical protein
MVYFQIEPLSAPVIPKPKQVRVAHTMPDRLYCEAPQRTSPALRQGREGILRHQDLSADAAGRSGRRQSSLGARHAMDRKAYRVFARADDTRSELDAKARQQPIADNAPTMPTAILPIRPNPVPRTSFPASQPAISQPTG